MTRIELPATLTAETDYTFDNETHETVEVVNLNFGGVVVKSWRVSEDEHRDMHRDPSELESFIAAKLAALFKD
jgi:hypothetical protein